LTYMAILGAGVAQASDPSAVGIAEDGRKEAYDIAQWGSSNERWI